MKKIILLFTSCVMSIFTYSNVDVSGHFRMDLSGQNISVNSISTYFSQYLDLPDNTTFTVFRDETDPMGYRHISYQQYVEGHEVGNGMVLVHAYNGVVLSMNGDVLTRTQQVGSATQTIRLSQLQALKKVRSSSDHAPIVLIKVVEDGTFVYHKAYKVKADFNTCYKYIDVYTGEIVKEESLVYSADVTGTAYTMYNGTQSFTCYSSNGSYYLHDTGRNFATYDATNAAPLDYTQEDGSIILETFRQSCSEFSNSSSIWNSPYHRYLTRITITALPCWSPEIGDFNPDLYLKIYDSAGNPLYTTGYKEDVIFPTSFSIQSGIESLDGRLIIKIYDYDPIGDDDYLGDFSIDVVTSAIDIPVLNPIVSGSVRFSEVGIQPALDIHWGMQKVMDFYRQVLNRNGHDNNGGVLYQFYNPHPDSILFSSMPINAFANYGIEPNFMVYGEGMLLYNNDKSMRPVVSLDVMAHEFTHLVTAHNGNGGLLYEDESGALNESFSDIMAMAVVNYVKGSCDWTIGADVMANAANMRSMSNPNNSGAGAQPKYYQGNYWASLGDYSASGDNGGVHTNSGVQNYWFYLLANGGFGTNEHGDSFSITGIGMADAVKIAYYNLLYYLSPEATFLDSRWGSIQACSELFGSASSQMQTVIDAWDAVGVYDYSLKPGKYLVYADGSDEAWFISANLTTTSTKRFAADTIANTSLNFSINPNPAFVWNVTQNSDGTYRFENNGKYMSWTSGNSGTMSTTPKDLDVTYDSDSYGYVVSFKASASETRTLSHNSANGSHYFAFYGNTNQDYILHFVEAIEAETHTIRVKKPADWSTTISAWVWNDDEEGHWESLTKEGNWYVYDGVGNYNIIFINGTTWNGDNNQTIDIAVSSDMCMQIGSETYGKRSCSTISCDDDPEPPVRTDCKSLPYTESFGTSQGDFIIEDVTLDGLSRVWQFSANYGMKASAFVSNVNHPTESWLISPCMELPEGATINLTFDHVYRYTTTPTKDLTLLISENHESGAPSTATWTPIAIPTYSSGSNWTFVNSGNINLSAYAGKTISIAFRYKSSSTAAATWEIKNVSVTSSPTANGVDNINNQNNATKCIIDGHMFIIRDGHKFTTTGIMIE